MVTPIALTLEVKTQHPTNLKGSVGGLCHKEIIEHTKRLINIQ